MGGAAQLQEWVGCSVTEMGGAAQLTGVGGLLCYRLGGSAQLQEWVGCSVTGVGGAAQLQEMGGAALLQEWLDMLSYRSGWGCLATVMHWQGCQVVGGAALLSSLHVHI